MREILFRGKTQKGEWVYGNYCGAEYLTGNGIEHLIIEVPKNGRSAQVIPETVGQYTGLTDKNGKKVFEGDIVKCQERFDRPYSKNRKSKRHIGVVGYKIRKGDRFYNPETNEWDRHMEYGAEWIVKVEDYGKFVHGSWGDFFDCEVIGNIHDTPELLKGE
jgi:uncharacterized phage protein (TIGR01671 family)